MANRYANIPGASKISQTYNLITEGFDKVQNDVDQLQDGLAQEIADREAAVQAVDERVDQIISEPSPNKDPELVDIRTPDPSYTPLDTITTAGGMTRDMQKQFVAHLNETATDDVHGLLSGGKIIEESGSNVNGRYIRFADGTQICYATVTFTDLDITVSANGVYRNAATISVTFPASFIDNNSVVTFMVQGILGIWPGDSGSGSGLTGSMCRPAFLCMTSGTYTFTARYMAIGRWK